MFAEKKEPWPLAREGANHIQEAVFMPIHPSRSDNDGIWVGLFHGRLSFCFGLQPHTWRFGTRAQRGNMHKGGHALFATDASDTCRSFHVNLVEGKILGRVVAANQVVDDIAVAYAFSNGRVILQVESLSFVSSMLLHLASHEHIKEYKWDDLPEIAHHFHVSFRILLSTVRRNDLVAFLAYKAIVSCFCRGQCSHEKRGKTKLIDKVSTEKAGTAKDGHH